MTRFFLLIAFLFATVLALPAKSFDDPSSTIAPKTTGKYPLALYDPKFAATQVLDGGQVSLSRLKSLVPDGTPNTFKPSSTIEFGQKYRFEVNGTKMEVKFHSPDLNAAQKFPGSNSGTQWTAQIKVGNKLLGADGKFYKKPSNNTTFRLWNYRNDPPR